MGSNKLGSGRCLVCAFPCEEGKVRCDSCISERLEEGKLVLNGGGVIYIAIFEREGLDYPFLPEYVACVVDWMRAGRFPATIVGIASTKEEALDKGYEYQRRFIGQTDPPSIINQVPL